MSSMIDKKSFIESESYQISKIENFDLFTQFVTGNLEKLEYKVIKYIFEFLDRNENHTAYNYYYLLRIIDKILADEPSNIKRVPRFFIDEHFIKTCYKVCPESVEFMTKFDTRVYLGTKLKYRILCNLIKSFKLLKASLDNE